MSLAIGSDDRVFDGLDGASAHAFAGRLRRELLLLLGEWVDPLARRPRRLLHDDELREAGQHEDAVLLQLAMADLDQGLDDLFDLLAGISSPTASVTASRIALFESGLLLAFFAGFAMSPPLEPTGVKRSARQSNRNFQPLERVFRRSAAHQHRWMRRPEPRVKPQLLGGTTAHSLHHREVGHVGSELPEALDLHAIGGDRVDEIIEKNAAFQSGIRGGPPGLAAHAGDAVHRRRRAG